ncbi:MAG: JAB domain-containing protein [Gemmatimonadetes bacterium]|nr:JAB domain-containing protein [Gemmatimonadota bacterium]MYF73380.1 JAB domain-containing protein [Gemmatimonadota bacterium]MYK52890.1 JAB domain-containing protein [Gemmatimonadota bacterium]
MNGFVKSRGGIAGVADVDMPREKLERLGPEGLRDEELLAILLRTGYEGRNVLEISRGIVKRYPVNKLVDMDLKELTTIKGIGRAKAAGLVAGFELAKRGLNQGIGIEPTITSPADVLGLLTDIKDLRKEYFVALFLNARNQVICRENVSVGSLNASLVHPREVFVPAVGSSAASVILAHNHPSGDVTPSREDIELTRRMVQAGEIMGIEVLDHLIVGSERFLSMKEANVF